MSFELMSLDKNDGLVQAVARTLAQQVHEPSIDYFADGELEISLNNPTFFNGKTVVIIQSTGRPVHDHIMQVAFLAHELKNAGACKVVGVIPYFGYSRQEKSKIVGRPGSAQVVAQLLEHAGIDELISVELHTPVLNNFFSIPVSSIAVHNQLAALIQKEVQLSEPDFCLIAPDAGAVPRVACIADILDVGFLTFQKQRQLPDITNVVSYTGECRSKVAVIIDDIIDTGGTVMHVARQLRAIGFERIYAYFVHPVLSAEAVQKIESAEFVRVSVSNTLSMSGKKQSPKIAVFDVSGAIVDALAKF